MAANAIVMYAVMKSSRMVEPAFHSRVLADQVAAAYGYGYAVREVVVTLPEGWK